MRRIIAMAIVAGSVALAVVVGQRMSAEAMAVVIGVVFGVAASIPTSLLIAATMRGRREEPRLASSDPRPAVSAPPQIYVVNPSAHAPGQAMAPWLTPGAMAQLPPPGGLFPGESSRRFKVVGEDEHWLEGE